MSDIIVIDAVTMVLLLARGGRALSDGANTRVAIGALSPTRAVFVGMVLVGATWLGLA
jgi:hypothetical protein